MFKNFSNIYVLLYFILTTVWLSVSSTTIFARESFTFHIGDQISIFADKAYRRLKDKKFEAIGNVIIMHGDETIYGESAMMDTITGGLQVVGNVRYIGNDITLYGSSLDYNTTTQRLNVENARIITGSFFVLGKKITRVEPNVFVAEEAEYTTCRDCPESWSVFGRKVRVTMKDYVHIQDALIKVNGMVVMYLPYMILPLKKGRQTGLLFPRFAISVSKGITYQQPWFWAISDNKDLTLTPSSFGKRGSGSELQYRHVVGDRKWFEVNSMFVYDNIYLPNKQTDENSQHHFFRHFTEYQQHAQFGNSFLHHLTISGLRDHDMVNDYGRYTNDKVRGSEVGLDGFLEHRNSLLNLGVESNFTNNNLTPFATNVFDDSYVQVLPKVFGEITPVTLLNETFPGMKNLSVGGRSTYTVFKQNHLDESNKIRNAARYTADPYIEWHLLNFGPLGLKSRYNFEYQNYHFRNPQEEGFRKYGSMNVLELSFAMDKIFGLAYRENIEINRIPRKKLDELQQNEKKEDISQVQGKDLIGTLPNFENSFTEDFILRKRNSYRHAQEFKLLHYYTTENDTKGNKRFNEQINDTSQEGLFDYVDAVRTKEHLLESNDSRIEIPTSNTIEFRWVNSLIRKQANSFDPYLDDRYLRQNFSYKNVAHFNLSQGVEINTQNSEFIDDLTRLHLDTGFALGKWSANFVDYYFYQTAGHIMTTSLFRTFDYAKLGLAYRWNTVVSPNTKLINLNGSVTPLNTITLGANYGYDLNKNESTTSTYSLGYSPVNNCWKVVFDYAVDPTQTKFSINFAVNFSENKFTAVGGDAGVGGVQYE